MLKVAQLKNINAYKKDIHYDIHYAHSLLRHEYFVLYLIIPHRLKIHALLLLSIIPIMSSFQKTIILPINTINFAPLCDAIF